ncbi:MAG: TetR family transcriptional regulator [Kiritimatiellae bacterium]|nr:TetR family transcriptional regulator [Kiritimatiellia bacterium]
MPRKTKEEAERTRARIVASALSLFVRKGYEHTTFTDIAARLKLTKGAVYWHFASKEALLVELVDSALRKFRRQIEGLMPTGELTYPAVADMMVKNAVSLVADPRGSAFFRLMKCQIRWSDRSMDSVRSDLLTDGKLGPKEAFRRAVANDVAAGRVAASVDAEEVATVSMALWDGLVQAKIDHFLRCDLARTLNHAYGAIWGSMRAGAAKAARPARGG